MLKIGTAAILAAITGLLLGLPQRGATDAKPAAATETWQAAPSGRWSSAGPRWETPPSAHRPKGSLQFDARDLYEAQAHDAHAYPPHGLSPLRRFAQQEWN